MRVLLSALLMMTVGLAPAAGPPVLGDFAHAWRLGVEPGAARYGVQLPERVYHGLTRPDLGDLRVFNASGQVVPHALQRVPVDRQRTRRYQDLPLFPLYADDPSVASLKLLLREDQGIGERVLHLHRKTEPGRVLSGYLLDLRGVRGPVDALSLDWRQGHGGEGFVSRVGLQASSNLEGWMRLVSGVTVAHLIHLGHEIRRDRIDFTAITGGYLRLSFADPDSAPELTSVRARVTEQVSRRRYATSPVSVRPGAEPGHYEFRTTGPLSLQQLRLSLPEPNTLAEARLYSRPDDDKSWRRRASATLYRLSYGEAEMHNDELSLGGLRDRDWRLEVDQSGGGLGNGLPGAEVNWVPDRLVFIARGEGPFTLAWGSARVGPVRGGPGVDLAAADAQWGRLAKARFEGDVFRASDDSVLRPPVDWRTWSLWAVLVLGAALLIWMAARLFRQMNAGKD